jgi:hypothetical protein
MLSYRQEKFAPTLLVAAVGASTIAAMFWMVGQALILRWYFYPSAVFAIFSFICLMRGFSKSYDHAIWKVCQWWSGFWSVAFLLTFCAPPFSYFIVGSLFAPIALDGGISPFLAAFAHIFIWACVTDILKVNSLD